MSVIIRAAAASDLTAVTHIYAHHVNHGTATFETEAPDEREMTRRWGEVSERGLPWLVAEDIGEVVGTPTPGSIVRASPIAIRSKIPFMSVPTVSAPALADC